MFLNKERFISQKVAEDLNLSSVIVVDDLLRDLRVKSRGVYVPSAMTGTNVKVFIPLRQDYELPVKARLTEDRAFLIDLANPAQEGVLRKPLGYLLFAHTSRDLKVDWRDARIETEDVEEHLQDCEQQDGFATLTSSSLRNVSTGALAELLDRCAHTSQTACQLGPLTDPASPIRHASYSARR